MRKLDYEFIFTCGIVAFIAALGMVAGIVDEFPAHEIPVHKECSLDGIDSTATDTEMRISPSLLCRSLHISHGNIHAPDKSYLSIDDTEFAMVAIVHLTRKGWKPNWHESLYTHSCLNHPFEEAVFHLPAPHIIDHYTSTPNCKYRPDVIHYE